MYEATMERKILAISDYCVSKQLKMYDYPRYNAVIRWTVFLMYRVHYISQIYLKGKLTLCKTKSLYKYVNSGLSSVLIWSDYCDRRESGFSVQ